MGRANRIHPGAHHRADDPVKLFDRHRHWAVIAYVALKLLSGRVREINAASGTIAGAFLLKLIFA